MICAAKPQPPVIRHICLNTCLISGNKRQSRLYRARPAQWFEPYVNINAHACSPMCTDGSSLVIRSLRVFVVRRD